MAETKKQSMEWSDGIVLSIQGRNGTKEEEKHVEILHKDTPLSYDPLAGKPTVKSGPGAVVGAGNRSEKVMAHRAHEAMTRKAESRTVGSETADKIKAKMPEAVKDKLRKVDEIYKKRSHRQWSSWKGAIWLALFVFQLIGAGISLALLYPNKPASGDWTDFGPRITMKVENVTNAVMLAISRITAYMMYPCVILTFLAKAHSLRTFLWKTQARLYLPFFERMHDVHIRSGWLCFFLTYLHVIFHVWRFARLQCLHLLYENQTGITGVVGTLCLTVVVLPFGLKFLRKKIKYEVRKWFHLVGGLGFGLSGALHAPATNVFIVYGIVCLIYILDWIFANLVKVYEVEVCHFTRLQDSVVLHWENPKGYNAEQHGYVNICIPFISRYEWHAISIYPHGREANSSSLCIARAGDWSKKLHAETTYKTTRPVWIQGPFLTPFSASVDYDNAICVSSGSGVSASLAAINSLKKHRRVNFIWLCRDATMIEYYLNTYDFDEDAYTLIFYTGKQKLSISHKLPPMVLIFETRPNLRNIVCMIIKSTESQDCLPENLVRESELNEEDMNRAANHLAGVEDQDHPLEMFHRLLGRSLKNFKKEELMQKLEGCSQAMPVRDFEHTLYKLCPEATFSQAALDKLAKQFEDKDTSMDGYVNLANLTKYVDASLEDYQTNGSRGTGPHAVVRSVSMEEVNDKFTKNAGEQALKDYMAEMDEEKVEGRLSRWAVLYCGGSLPVSTELTKVCQDFDIKYDQEKFDW